MNVLFVCVGGICRSPLAKGILQQQFDSNKINGKVEAAGLEPHHIGHPVDKRTLRVAKEHSIDLSGYTMRLFSPDDFNRFDRIYVMDQHDYREVEYVAKKENDMKKVDYVMNVIDDEKRSKIVPDPLYKGYASFEKIYEKLERACKIIADEASH
ncbi:MAG TPA: low molecular weight protein-tyrosine-phosphatase [Bacteroidales bacterium]|nr:low molecular weight protein-tyrosine-phosphatase [Bacteroidales bacterium]